MLVNSSLRGILFGSLCQRASSAGHRGIAFDFQPRSIVRFAGRSCARACQGGDPFSTWLTANPLPDTERPAQQPDEGNVPHAPGLSRLSSRRFHYSAAAVVVRELCQRYNAVDWSLAHKAFVFTTDRSAAVTSGDVSPYAPSYELNVLPERGQPWVSLRLPPVLSNAGSFSAADGGAFLRRIAAGEVRAVRLLIALLAADSAALAVWEDGQLLRHKTLTGYTVRKQQGGSQLKHLRSGAGKQSAGGALRSRETRRFFLAVAERLRDWNEDVQSCDLLVFSGGARAWNEVFNTNEAVWPVPRQDPRWLKAPISVRRPRFNDIERVLNVLCHGEVAWEADTESQQTDTTREAHDQIKDWKPPHTLTHMNCG